jgi:hypothetical protein
VCAGGFTRSDAERHPDETRGCDARRVPTLVRPRTAALCLRLDPHGRPADSDLTLATRAGEVVWRGQVSPGAWVVGLRLRDRCTGTRADALWLLTRALLEAELVTHGLHREGPRDLHVDVTDGAEGCVLDTRCGVIPIVHRSVPDAPTGGLDEHVRRASRQPSLPATPLASSHPLG